MLNEQFFWNREVMMRNDRSDTKTGDAMEAFRSASLTGSDVPRRVLLAPWGQIESTNGSFVVDDESARLVVEAFEQHGTDLPIDYEHQTLGGTYASPSGQAPAAGWIRRILSEPGVGLLAEIDWTDQAEQVLAANEYRYLSPVAIIRKTDRKLVALHSAALTNKPAIVGMQPIVHRQSPAGDVEDLEPLAALRDELDMDDHSSVEQVLVAASQRLGEMQRAVHDRQIKQRVDQELSEGKLVEAQRGWAETLVAREEQLFDEWLASAPVLVTRGATVAPKSSTASAYGRGAEASARSEFRSNPFLARITTEDAYVSLALTQR